MSEFILEVGGPIFTAFVLALLAFMHIRGVRPPIARTWRTPATLRLPDGLDEELRELARVAWTKWAQHGAPCGLIVEGGSPTPSFGEILITGPMQDYDPSHGDETHWAVTEDTPECLWAHCQILVRTYAVVLHAMGHGLGVEHVSKRGHVMASSLARLGDSMEGVPEAFALVYGRTDPG